MDRALDEAERRGGVGRGSGDHLECPGRQPGRCHVDRLLEIGTLERIRLVEHRQDLEGAAPQQALDGDLLSGDVALDDERPAGVLAGFGQDRPDPSGRRAGVRRIVDADHTTTARQGDGLEDAGDPHIQGERSDVGVGPGDPVLGLGYGRGPERPRIAALSRLLAAASGGLCARPRRCAASAATSTP